MNPPVFAHRYLDDGSVEIICMNCLDIVCKVPHGGDSTPFLDFHVCQLMAREALEERPDS